MREHADAERIGRLVEALGKRVPRGTRVYLVGGATAVLLGWRESTIDVDLVLVPESDEALRAIAELKDELQVNVELASPLDFIPVPDGWEERGRYVTESGGVSFYHFDLEAQALAKAERGHEQDLVDIEAMLASGLIEATEIQRRFKEIEPQLYRFPALDANAFRASVQRHFGI